MAKHQQHLRDYMVRGPVVYGTKRLSWVVQYSTVHPLVSLHPLRRSWTPGFWPSISARKCYIDSEFTSVMTKLTLRLFQVAQVPAPRVDARNVCTTRRLWSLRAVVHLTPFAIVLHPRSTFSLRRCCRIAYDHRTFPGYFYSRCTMYLCVGSLSQPPLVPVSGSSSSTPSLAPRPSLHSVYMVLNHAGSIGIWGCSS